MILAILNADSKAVMCCARNFSIQRHVLDTLSPYITEFSSSKATYHPRIEVKTHWRRLKWSILLNFRLQTSFNSQLSTAEVGAVCNWITSFSRLIHHSFCFPLFTLETISFDCLCTLRFTQSLCSADGNWILNLFTTCSQFRNEHGGNFHFFMIESVNGENDRENLIIPIDHRGEPNNRLLAINKRCEWIQLSWETRQRKWVQLHYDNSIGFSHLLTVSQNDANDFRSAGTSYSGIGPTTTCLTRSTIVLQPCSSCHLQRRSWCRSLLLLQLGTSTDS